MDGQGTTWRGNIAENFNRLSRVHQRYRRQTDRQTDDRQTDGRWHIANMNLSSRSLKTTVNYVTRWRNRIISHNSLMFNPIHLRTRHTGDTLAYLCQDGDVGSGVTKVGVTQGGNWWCHLFFPPKKLTTFFSHRPLQIDDLFSCRLLTTPNSDVVYRVFFLNSAKKNINFSLCHSLDWGGPPPSPSLVTPLDKRAPRVDGKITQK